MEDASQPIPARGNVPPPAYEPPAVTYLGDLADLTMVSKELGGADGSTFLGLDIGS